MFRILGALLALVLVFGLVFADTPDSFDVMTGTGTVGVGEFAPPGQEEAPTAVTALGIKTITHTWTCTRIDNPERETQGVGVTTQSVKSVGEANLNVRGNVTNYTFGGWTTYGGLTFESDHRPYEWRGINNVNCTAEWTLTNIDTLVDYSFVGFSY